MLIGVVEREMAGQSVGIDLRKGIADVCVEVVSEASDLLSIVT